MWDVGLRVKLRFARRTQASSADMGTRRHSSSLLLLPHGASWKRTSTCWRWSSHLRVACRAKRWQQRWPAPRAAFAVRRLGPPGWARLLLLLPTRRPLAVCRLLGWHHWATRGVRERVVVAVTDALTRK